MDEVTDLRSCYQRRRDRAEIRAVRLDRQASWLSNIRLATFLAAAGLAIAAWAHASSRWAGAGAGAFALLFLAAAVAYDRVVGAYRRARLHALVNEHSLARQEGRWSEHAGDGARFASTEHPYANDLDLFGPNSLFQLLDVTTTLEGEEELARWLLAPAATADEVCRRQEAVRELAPQLDFRQDLEVEGRMVAASKLGPKRLLAWAEGPPLFALPFWRVVACVLPAWTIASWLAAHRGIVPNAAWLVTLAVQGVLVLATARRVATFHRQVFSPGERLLWFDRVFATVERLQPQCAALQELSERIRVEGEPPSFQMRRLSRALSFFAAREQPLFHVPLNVLFLWDLHWVCVLERWRAATGPRLRGWFQALGTLEALSSLAGFAHDNPSYAFPAVAGTETRLVAEELGHPLLPAARRVTNDVALPSSGSVLLVTGSNMSGKTTLLRTLGVNAVLALAGAPVCAKSMTLARLHVTTSMRVQDSLAQGLSFFYAELKRLKAVLEQCRGRPALFLLDEVLQGTNTAERQAASRAIVRRLVEMGAIGAVATHDVGLTTLEAETGSKVRNVHFTDRIDNGEMTFDYRMRPGVVTTTNALALLKRLGIDVDIGD